MGSASTRREEVPLVRCKSACNSEEGVVTLDLSKGETECARIMREAALKGIGFFFLQNHGVSKELLDSIGPLTPDFRERFRVARKRYLPAFHHSIHKAMMRMEEKEDTTTATTQNEETLDWLDECEEAIQGDVNLVQLKDMCRYYTEAFKLSRRMHRIIALSLGFPANHLDALFEKPLDILQLNHYPGGVPLDADQGELAMGPHTDVTFATLLLTDGLPGLQVCKDKSKPLEEREWIPVTPQEENTFAINFGDLCERWTNGKYKSVLHRVENTEGRERKSVAFFCDPSTNATIAPIIE